MTDFSDIRKNIDQADRLTSSTELELQRLRAAAYPDDYIEFMSQIGFGNLGDLQIYSEPINPISIYPSSGDKLDDIVLFGDDFQGYCFGFDKVDGMRVVEVDPKGTISRAVESTFSSFIRGYFG